MRRGTVNLVKNFMLQKIQKAQASGFVDGSIAADMPTISEGSERRGSKRMKANKSVQPGINGSSLENNAGYKNGNSSMMPLAGKKSEPDPLFRR